MSDRRRLLMAISNTGKWLPYSFEYLYHDLIPTTISGKSVKNKLKLATIYGNSEVRNQLTLYGDFSSSSGWYTIGSSGSISVSNNVATITKTSSNIVYLYRGNADYPTLTNHKYLHIADIKLSANGSVRFTCGNAYQTAQSVSANTWTKIVYLASPTTFGGFTSCLDDYNSLSIGDTLECRLYEMIDLTQEYPFDTPTTLTDNRVQNILNNGYIPFNSGELKSVDIGEFSSVGRNIWDGVWEHGNINNSGEESSNNEYGRTSFIEIKSTTTYYCYVKNSDYRLDIFQYDNNKNFIQRNANVDNNTFTSTSNCKYIRFRWLSKSSPTTIVVDNDNDISIYVSNVSYNGFYYAYTTQTIPFKYQGGGVGTSHDSMTIDKDNVVFVKNNATVDLGTLTWSKYTSGSNWLFYANVSGGITGVGQNNPVNILCSKYECYKYANGGYATAIGDDDMCSWDATNSQALIKDTSYSSETDFKTSMSGVMLEYQLATPQTITIPRKKLGCVDLGSLTYNISGDGTYIYSDDLDGLIKATTSLSEISNLYSNKYFAGSFNEVIINHKSYSINCYVVSNKARLLIANTDNYTNPTDFKNAMSGQYLFYETQDEVADIIDTLHIESGGTFTSDSEVLPNVDVKIKGK